MAKYKLLRDFTFVNDYFPRKKGSIVYSNDKNELKFMNYHPNIFELIDDEQKPVGFRDVIKNKGCSRIECQGGCDCSDIDQFCEKCRRKDGVEFGFELKNGVGYVIEKGEKKIEKLGLNLRDENFLLTGNAGQAIQNKINELIDELEDEKRQINDLKTCITSLIVELDSKQDKEEATSSFDLPD